MRAPPGRKCRCCSRECGGGSGWRGGAGGGPPPGAVFGEVSFFDGGARAATCTALKPATVFSLPTAVLHQLLAGGNNASWKVLSHLAQTLVWYLRLANIRLRQRVAERNHEADKALEARRMARAEQLLMAEDGEARDGLQPVVVREPRLEAGACLAWILQPFDRPAPVFLVAEACAAGGGVLEGLAEGARQYGLSASNLGSRRASCGAWTAPSSSPGTRIASSWHTVGGAGAWESWTRRPAIATFPRRKLRGATRDAASRYSGRPPAGRGKGLVRKVTRFVAERRGAVARLVGTTFLLQVAELAIPLTMGLVIEGICRPATAVCSR